MSSKSVSCILYGGLGNQLFQIFATIAYALEHNREFWFEYTPSLGKRPTYWHNFLAELQPHLHRSEDSISNGFTSLMQLKETQNNKEGAGGVSRPTVGGNVVPLEEPHIYESHNEVKYIILNGYFQSPVYFEKWYNEIIIKCGLKLYNNNNNTVSMHFRRGDYKEIQECHPILNTNYYIRALDYVCTLDPGISIVQYYCEDEDHADIVLVIDEFLKLFPSLVFKRFKGNTDYEEMLSMAKCKHNIIANSSFSWWGAYFNPCSEKIVCYPSLWFGPMIPKSVDSMFPSSWTKVAL